MKFGSNCLCSRRATFLSDIIENTACRGVISTILTCLFKSWKASFNLRRNFYLENLRLFDSNDSNNFFVMFVHFKSITTCSAQDAITLKNSKDVKLNPSWKRKLHNIPNYLRYSHGNWIMYLLLYNMYDCTFNPLIHGGNKKVTHT